MYLHCTYSNEYGTDTTIHLHDRVVSWFPMFHTNILTRPLRLLVLNENS